MKVGKHQLPALEAVRKFPGRTVRELAIVAGIADHKQLKRRVSELLALGAIEECGVKRCDVTRYRATTFRVAPDSDTHPIIY